MGAGQSAQGGSKAAAAAPEIKQSYYELIGVERDATEDEYARPTLWHPTPGR